MWVLLISILVGQSAIAGTVHDFKSSSADVIKNRSSLTKFKPTMKPKSGGVVIPLHRIDKLSPYSAAAALAVAGASIYWEDELNMSLNELFLGDELPPTPDGWVDADTPPAGGKDANLDGFNDSAAEDACIAYSDATYGGGHFIQVNYVQVYSGDANQVAVNCKLYTSSWSQTNKQVLISNTYTGSSGQLITDVSDVTTWPDDGVAMAKVENDTMKFWDAETNTFSLSDPLFYATPEGVGSVEIHAGNIAKIHEWLEVNDAAGNTQTIHEYVTIDANTGAVIGAAQETINKPLDEAIADDPQRVSVEFPSSMDVNVLANGVEGAQGPKDHYDGSVIGALPNFTEQTIPTLPAFVDIDNLPSYRVCKQITIDILGYGALQIPGEQGCQAMEIRKEMYGWYMVIITVFACLVIITRPTAHGI